MFKMSAFSVDTGRQMMPSTRRWHGSQQTGPANHDIFITSLATLSLSNKKVNACPVLYIFSSFNKAKIIEIS